MGTHLNVRLTTLAAVGCVLAVIPSTVGAEECDRLVSNLIAGALRPSIAGLSCGGLGKAGIDRAEHSLTNVCYTSSGLTSSVEITASLKCSNSPKALIRVTVAERVTARANVDGIACKVTSVEVTANGEIGKLLVEGLDAAGAARTALEKVLDGSCS